MSKLYFTAILLSLGIFASAQSFTVRPSTVKDTTVDARGSVDSYIYFDNAFQSPLTLTWEETNVSYPSGWLMTVCDNFLCYTIPHAFDTMSTVGSGEYGFLKITCTPLEVLGSGTVSYHVWDANNPLYTTNVTFNFNVTGGTSVTVTQPTELFTVTPVPAHDVLHLSARNGQLEKGTVKLFDLKGQLILDQTVNAVSSTDLDVHSLAPGMYMLRYESKAGVMNQKVVVTH
jgi:hypothetical protein